MSPMILSSSDHLCVQRVKVKMWLSKWININGQYCLQRRERETLSKQWTVTREDIDRKIAEGTILSQDFDLIKVISGYRLTIKMATYIGQWRNA